MLARTWIPVALTLLLAACGGDKNKDGAGTGTNDSSPTQPAPSPLEVFEASDWYGSVEIAGGSYPCEADLYYDADADKVFGTMVIDAQWEVVIEENEDGTFSGVGTLFGDPALTLENLAVSDEGVFTGDYTWESGANVFEGSFTMEAGGPPITQ